jgi:predicted SAM-dependent methyltransferase
MSTPKPDADNALSFSSLRHNAIPALKVTAAAIARSAWPARLARFINRRLYDAFLGAALNRYDASFTVYLTRKDRELYSAFPPDALFVNFGSGAFQHPRWRNYDYPGLSDYYRAIQGEKDRDFFPIDLCQPGLSLPFETNSVSLIYCSHTLEHLEVGAAKHFLSECARILAENGVLRLALPNTGADFAHSSVVHRQEGVGQSAKAAALRSAASHILSSTSSMAEDELHALVLETRFDARQFFDRAKEKVHADFDPTNPERHISFWSHDNLAELTGDCGFACYLPMYRGASTQAPFRNLHVFDATEPHIAFYGEFIGRSSSE